MTAALLYPPQGLEQVFTRPLFITATLLYPPQGLEQVFTRPLFITATLLYPPQGLEQVYEQVNSSDGAVHVNVESCDWLNVIIDFIFRELRDSPVTQRSVTTSHNLVSFPDLSPLFIRGQSRPSHNLGTKIGL